MTDVDRFRTQASDLVCTPVHADEHPYALWKRYRTFDKYAGKALNPRYLSRSA
jgi:hypothetical protein